MNNSPWPPEKWTEMLWGYFLPQVQSGKAVYFSIDRSLLQKLIFQKDSSRSDDPIEHLASSCNALFDIYNQRIHVKSEVFAKNEFELSNIICFVALQVVTVELMTNDTTFSEQAYFPRLRELLGISDVANPYSNPFHKNQLEHIWTLFKSEILSRVGGTINSITFRKGKGQNLHRELPFSQALLTGGELYRLYSKYENELNRIDTTSKAFNFLRSKRGFVSERSKKIINSAINNEVRALRFGRQLLDFIENPTTIVEQNAIKNIQEEYGTLKAFRSAEFFSNEKINIYYIDESGKQQVDATKGKLLNNVKMKDACYF